VETVHVTTVVIGAGHSGLAMSRRLTERAIDHVVLERGEVANSWRTERWDSLRLLTPTWHVTLPGDAVPEGDPDGFLSVPDLVAFLDGYAERVEAPVHTGTTVTRVGPTETGYEVVTDRGTWTCDTVVLASGGSNVAALPAAAEGVPEEITSISTARYRSPDDVPDGGVLVVGASASGVQLADELARAGHAVTVAAGEHVRMPRTYRGRDAFWWMEHAGVLDERYDEVDDIIRARHTPSPQLVGGPDRADLDLRTLQEQRGVRIVGKLGRLRDGVAQFSGGLANTVRLADLKLGRLLDRFDDWADQAGPDDLDDPHRPEPTPVETSPRLELDLRREGIRTVLWATGYRADRSWLALPVLDHKGRLRHEGGVVIGAPGVYVLGTSLLRRRRSTYIGGADRDTAELAAHLAGHLAGRSAPPGEGVA
jgi:putative flavoprotein involved in K+ transport